MFSPPLLFFFVAVVGSLLGLVVEVTLYFGGCLFVGFLAGAIFLPVRFLRALLVCCALAIFVATMSSFEKQRYDAILNSLSYEAKVYEGVVLDLSDSLKGDKIGLLKIDGEFTVAIKLVGAASAKKVEIGDRIRLKGKLAKAQHALSPGQMDGYLFGLSRGVQGRITISDPHLIAVMQTDGSKSVTAHVKQTLKNHLTTHLTPREAGLMLALIVGDVKLFDDEQQLQYRNIGAGHLLAVSGLQVSILSVIFYRLFLFLSLLIPWISRRSLARYPALAFTLVLVWSFIFLCGAPPSAVRAGLMTTLMLVASTYGWPTTSMDILGASGLLILLFHPSSVTDPSLWLSYAAVFGLIVAAQALKISADDLLLLNPGQNHSDWRTKAQSLVVSSLGAGLLTLPFSAFYFAEVSLSGLLVNLFLVPVAGFLQTPAILLVALGVLLGIPFLSQAAAFFAGVLDSMCMTLDAWLGHTFTIVPLSGPQLVLMTLAGSLLIASASNRHRLLKLSAAVVCVIVAFAPLLLRREDHLRATFLPVGQGDAAVLEIPPGKVIVIDGGGNHDDSYNPGARVITPFLRRRNIDVIDVIILSHPDADHLMGLLPLFDNFKVKELWHNGFDDSHPLMARLLMAAQTHGVKLRSRSDMAQRFHLGGAQIDFISPPEKNSHSKELSSTNNRSLVIRVSFERTSILLPGDIEEVAENALTSTNQDLRATVVKAPHHGSKGSSSEKFVRSTKASHVVFCTGVNNRFGFPHAQVIQRWQEAGASLWDTAVNGETTFVLHDGIVEVEPFLVTSKEIS